MQRIITISFLFLLILPVSAQKVFKVKYESQAGWRNEEKMHLLKF